MKMKFRMKDASRLLTIASVTLIAGAGFAGGNVGHGGGGFACFNANHEISRVELLDFWEANLRLSPHKIDRSKVLIADQIATALKRLATIDFGFAKKVEEQLMLIQGTKEPSIIKPVPPDQKILPPTDANYDLAPDDCTAVGIATYWDEWNILWISFKHYDKLMSETDKAGLFMHEAIYKVLRGSPWRDQDSIRARKIVGILFAPAVDFERDRGILAQLLRQ